MHYVDKPPPLTLFLTPKGVGIGREKGVAFGRDLTRLRPDAYAEGMEHFISDVTRRALTKFIDANRS
jgi:hypothetical protein